MNIITTKLLPTALITTVLFGVLYNPKNLLSEENLKKKNTPKVDVHININGTDTMMYSKTSFEVKSGQKVKLTFNNIGKLPKAAMGHNVVILKKSVNLIGFCTEAIKFPAEGYFPKSREKDVIGRTKLLGPGEKDEIYFTAPAPGTYEYVCTFPGHFALMKGKMIVK